MRLEHLSTNAITVNDVTAKLSPIKQTLSSSTNLYNRKDDKDLPNDGGFHNHNINVAKCNKKDAIGGGNNHNGNGNVSDTKSLNNVNNSSKQPSTSTSTTLHVNPTNLSKQHEKMEIAKDLRLTTKLHNISMKNENGASSFVMDNYSNQLDNYLMDGKTMNIMNSKNCKERNAVNSAATTLTATKDHDIAVNSSTTFINKQQTADNGDIYTKVAVTKSPSKAKTRKSCRTNDSSANEQLMNIATIVNSNHSLVKCEDDNNRTLSSPDKNKCYEEVRLFPFYMIYIILMYIVYNIYIYIYI